MLRGNKTYQSLITETLGFGLQTSIYLIKFCFPIQMDGINVKWLNRFYKNTREAAWKLFHYCWYWTSEYWHYFKSFVLNWLCSHLYQNLWKCLFRFFKKNALFISLERAAIQIWIWAPRLIMIQCFPISLAFWAHLCFKYNLNITCIGETTWCYSGANTWWSHEV